MKVACEVNNAVLKNDYGQEVEGVRVTCGACGHETESFGTSEKSVKRCLVLMKQECPHAENNFYVDADDE